MFFSGKKENVFKSKQITLVRCVHTKINVNKCARFFHAAVTVVFLNQKILWSFLFVANNTANVFFLQFSLPLSFRSVSIPIGIESTGCVQPTEPSNRNDFIYLYDSTIGFESACKTATAASALMNPFISSKTSDHSS